MPALFEKHGLRFLYPENWSVEETEDAAGGAAVSVQSPGGAFWAVSRHPRSVRPGPLLEGVVDTLRGEYENLDAEQVREEFAGHHFVGWDVNFIYLDLTNTAMVRAVRTGDATLLFYWQAEDREFSQVEPVIRAMMASLLAEDQATEAGL